MKVVILILMMLTSLSCKPFKKEKSPKLILVIAVDQLRADLVRKYTDRFTKGGFNKLLREGVHFENTHNEQASTLTAIAHSTMGTGAYSREHGIIGNEWYDRELNKRVTSVRDQDEKIIGTEQVGKSPFRLLATTFGDELMQATSNKAKVFGVSVKDRASILMTGKRGKAFWYSYSSGEFISSTYYYSSYPKWVSDWNTANQITKLINKTWSLSQPIKNYVNIDNRPFEREPYGMSRTFPKSFNLIDSNRVASALRYTPFTDEHTLNFAIELIDKEKLGKDEVTDLLSISFSSTDFIGHAYGPKSREQEDNLIRLDRTLEKLFSYLEEEKILKQTLIVLTADHGVDEIPESRKQLSKVKKRNLTEIFIPALNKHLKKKFNSKGLNIVREADRFRSPYIFFNLENINKLGLNVNVVESEAVAFVEGSEKGIARAIPRHKILSKQLDKSALSEQVYKSFHSSRSGNIHLITKRNWYLNNRSDDNMATHGSPYEYDSHVPLIISGMGIKPRTVSERVGLADIAPTLSHILVIPKPSHTTGKSLDKFFLR